MFAAALTAEPNLGEEPGPLVHFLLDRIDLGPILFPRPFQQHGFDEQMFGAE
jgi:hypothetical protein